VKRPDGIGSRVVDVASMLRAIVGRVLDVVQQVVELVFASAPFWSRSPTSCGSR
jgi:hypothetical protein